MSAEDPNDLKKPSGGEVPEPSAGDDAGTQALSEALRSSFFIIRFIMILLVALFFASGFFVVDVSHRAIILRLGRPLGGEGEKALLGPGLHFAFPRPFDQVEQIEFRASQQADSTVGWYQSVADRLKAEPPPPPLGSLDPATISYVVTADTNIIHLRAMVRYRITKPVRFHFEFADAAKFVTNDLNNALLFTASHFKVDDILSDQPTRFQEAVEARMKSLVDAQDLGITVDGVDVPEKSAPLLLVPDFARVGQAIQTAGNKLNEARINSSKVLANARGEVTLRTNNAWAEASRTVQIIGAEATNFSGLLPYYERDPQLVRRLLLTETLSRIRTNAQQIAVIPDLESFQLRLHLSGPVTPQAIPTNQPGQ